MFAADRTVRVLATLAVLAAPAVRAQAPERTESSPTRLHFLATAGGLTVQGPFGEVTPIPASGAGTRLMWWPAASAFRAGTVDGTRWDLPNVGLYSVAMGLDAQANGPISTAMGAYTIASGASSTALGEGTEASGTASFAVGSGTSAGGAYATSMGWNTRADLQASTAMGHNTVAGGEYSTAMGQGGQATGRYATVMGHINTASGEASTAMGVSTQASGFASTAMGNATTASGIASVAMGQGTTASGQFSMAMGFNTTASGLGAIALGSHATTDGYEGAFVIGDRSTVTQSNPLLRATGSNQFRARFDGGYYLLTSYIPGAPGALLPGGGTSWTTLSDSTRKERFRPYDPEAVLSGLRGLRLGTWNYRGQDPATMRHWGPMAQDFHRAFGHDGVGGIGTDTTIATQDADGVLFAAAQALEARTRDLEARIEALEAERHRERSLGALAFAGLLGVGLAGVALRRRRVGRHG